MSRPTWLLLVAAVLLNCTPLSEAGSAVASATPTPSAMATDPGAEYFAPITGFRYASVTDGSDKAARQLLIAPAAKGAVTGLSSRTITSSGDPYGVSVSVFSIDPITAARPGLQRDLAQALAGKERTVRWGVAGRALDYYESGSIRTYAWLQRTYFVVVSSEDYAKLERITALLINANTSEARFVLAGQVTSKANGAPIANVRVAVLLGGGGECCYSGVPAVRSGSTGRFQVTVPEGIYRIQYYPSGIDGYGVQWWKDAADYDSATDIVVTNRNIALLDAALPTGYVLEGEVLDGSGRLVEAAHVDVFNADGHGGFVAGAQTSAAGRFVVRLPDGRYRLYVEGPDGTKLEPRWWPDAASIDKSEAITIAAGAVPKIEVHLGGGLTQ